MIEEKAIQCGARRFTIRRYPDGVVGVFDENGRMIVGWPETTAFGSTPLDQRNDAEWCTSLARIRKIN